LNVGATLQGQCVKTQAALRAIVCCGFGLLLTACSTTRLAYNHLDTFLHWVISDYVDLDDAQRKTLDADFDTLWDWHRRTQLPLYAADLRELADAVQAGPLSLEQVRAFSVRAEQRGQDLITAALPGYIRMNAGLSDVQIAHAFQRLNKEIDEDEHRREKLPAEERRKRRISSLEHALTGWIGKLTPPQRQMAEQWGAADPPQPSASAAEQHAILARYAALLADRRAPGFEERLRRFLLAEDDRDANRASEMAEEKRWLQFLADLSATLEPAQRGHLRKRLLGYVADCQSLANEAPTRIASSTNR
jgi:hypothetical protein